MLNSTSGTMTVCSACGSPSFRRERIAEYEDEILGYPVVLHDAVYRIFCSDCSHRAIFIPDMPRLLATVAAVRVRMPEKLSGRELQLIRKSTGLRAVDFADKVSVAPETLSRWENNKEPMPLQTEKGVRLLLLNILSSRSRVTREDYEQLIDLEITPFRPGKWTKMHFERVKVRDADKKGVDWETAEELEAA